MKSNSKAPLRIVIAALFLGMANVATPVLAIPRTAEQGAFEEASGLLAMAVAAAETARGDEAIRISKEIFNGPYPNVARFRAALLIADLYATKGSFVLAKFWARRAFEVASPQERTAAALLYQRIEAASPLSVSARLSFAPSSNVNNGGETKIIVIGGFPFVFGDSSLRLSGIEATGGATLIYKISQTSRSLTEAYGDVSFRKVWLDSRSGNLAPEVSNSDFDQLGFSAGLRHSWQAVPVLGPTSASLSFGQGYVAGEQVTDWRAIELRQVVYQRDQRSLGLSFAARADDRLDNAISSSTSRRIGATFQQGLTGGQTLTFQIAVNDVNSDSALVWKDEASVSVSIGRIRLGPVEAAAGFDAAIADYPGWILTPGGRRDVSGGLSLEVTYGAISFLGFSPTVALNARHTESNIDVFDRQSLSVGLSFSSNF
jgi:hypothetical protein